jgi:hypothetical protein
MVGLISLYIGISFTTLHSIVEPLNGYKSLLDSVTFQLFVSDFPMQLQISGLFKHTKFISYLHVGKNNKR